MYTLERSCAMARQGTTVAGRQELREQAQALRLIPGPQGGPLLAAPRLTRSASQAAAFMSGGLHIPFEMHIRLSKPQTCLVSVFATAICHPLNIERPNSAVQISLQACNAYIIAPCSAA